MKIPCPKAWQISRAVNNAAEGKPEDLQRVLDTAGSGDIERITNGIRRKIEKNRTWLHSEENCRLPSVQKRKIAIKAQIEELRRLLDQITSGGSQST